MLWTLGTAQELEQIVKDPRENWKPGIFNYQDWVNDRVKADWTLSILVEPGSGHFCRTEGMTGYFALSINAACRARVSDDGSPTLKPVSLENGVRFGVQPAAVKLMPYSVGAVQAIAFDPIPEVKAGTESIKLTAAADSGLPVEFFVVSGPAKVKDGRLEFTAIPPRSRFPVDVTVAAWLWGRHRDPKIKAADIMRQTFHLVR